MRPSEFIRLKGKEIHYWLHRSQAARLGYSEGNGRLTDIRGLKVCIDHRWIWAGAIERAGVLGGPVPTPPRRWYEWLVVNQLSAA